MLTKFADTIETLTTAPISRIETLLNSKDMTVIDNQDGTFNVRCKDSGDSPWGYRETIVGRDALAKFVDKWVVNRQ